MIIFYINSPIFKKKHIQSMIHVFEYINHIIVSPKILHVDINVNNDSDSYFDNIDAFTVIKQSDKNKFPIRSSITFMYHSMSYEMKYFSYLLLHELFHALGCMISPHTKWREMIDQENNTYTGKYATEKYVSLFKLNKSIKLKLHQETECVSSNHNHIDGIYDFFSAEVHENISPVSLFLLKDYGYNIIDNYEMKL